MVTLPHQGDHGYTPQAGLWRRRPPHHHQDRALSVDAGRRIFPAVSKALMVESLQGKRLILLILLN